MIITPYCGRFASVADLSYVCCACVSPVRFGAEESQNFGRHSIIKGARVTNSVPLYKSPLKDPVAVVVASRDRAASFVRHCLKSLGTEV